MEDFLHFFSRIYPKFKNTPNLTCTIDFILLILQPDLF